MGVPRLFPYIIKNFFESHIVIKNPRYRETASGRKERVDAYFQVEKSSGFGNDVLSKSPYILEVDNLLLDSNPFLHGAAQKIFAYDGGKRHVKFPYDEYSFEDKIKLVLEVFLREILDILKFVKPKKMLYIALDGPAPWAKITQQRERRFKSASTRKGVEFDSNSITPGTYLMSEVTRYMNTKIREIMNKKNSMFPPQVIFSPCTVPGEGEHKLIGYLRENYGALKNESHCIYGPDADLIMLALATHMEKFYVIRPDTQNDSVKHILNFERISYKLPLVLRATKLKESHRWAICNDFILMGFFVGNDFLPKIQMFLYLEDGLNFMLFHYQRMFEKNPDHTLTYYDNIKKRYCINLAIFTDLVKFLYTGEEDELVKSLKRPLKHEMFVNETLKKHVKKDVLDYKNYRKDYYKKAGIEDDEGVDKMCLNYIRGMFWVLQYYLNGVQSWSFSYQYHYPPLMKDLYLWLYKNKDKQFDDYELDTPLYPFEQLLAVLPPSSSKLLPTPYRVIMTDEESELVKRGFYKELEDGDIDYEGKTEEFMGVVLTPFVDRNAIREEYSKVTNSGIKQFQRNVLARNQLFYRDENMVASYTSKFGNIKPLHVRKKLL